MKLKIVTAPNPVLFTVAEPIKEITQQIKKIIADMKETLLAADNPKGIGLAAPQVGISLQLFIIKLSETDSFHVYINPKVKSESPEMDIDKDLMEGCLSIPKIWGPTKRFATVQITFMDENGTNQTETHSGLMSTVIQHEFDHLNGKLFTGRVLEQNGKLYRAEKQPDGKEIFTEVEIG